MNRRDFLRSLQPSWLTLKTLKILAIAALAVCVLSLVRKLGILSMLKTLGFISGFLLVAWLVGRLLEISKRFYSQLSPFPRALLKVTGQIIQFSMLGACGAYIYMKWERGDELHELLFGLVIFFIFRVRDQLESEANQAPEPTAPSGRGSS
ncbi:MAG: hypothetical protein ACAH89_07665 [Rariglobus sp.]|nr:hypothetical protein [Rariglobus sp.]